MKSKKKSYVSSVIIGVSNFMEEITSNPKVLSANTHEAFHQYEIAEKTKIIPLLYYSQWIAYIYWKKIHLVPDTIPTENEFRTHIELTV